MTGLDTRGVATVVLDDPTTRNALGLAALRDLDDTLTGLADDPALRAVVLTGAGSVFSSGANRTEIGDADTLALTARLLERLLVRVATLPVPVVARVNGAAFGAGLALAVAADLSVAVDDATFALPEVRFGLVAGPALAVCRPRLGQAALLDLFLTGRRFDAVEAVGLGLISRAVPAAELDRTVASVLADLLSGEAAALAATKRAIRGGVAPLRG